MGPHNGTNCIQHTIFRNIVFLSPLKAIYIKTNPGTKGDGRIFNITYEDIVMYQDPQLFPQHAFLWPIYIGPQQQKEPGGGGPGCFVDFIRCPSQPLVNLTNIYLRNVTAVNSILTNPCTDFVFEDVKFVNSTDYVPWDELYVCLNVDGKFIGCEPEPHFLQNVTFQDSI